MLVVHLQSFYCSIGSDSRDCPLVEGWGSFVECCLYGCRPSVNIIVNLVNVAVYSGVYSGVLEYFSVWVPIGSMNLLAGGHWDMDEGG